MQYAESFKLKMIEKMTGPGARSTSSLSKECGVAQATLWRWQHQAKLGGTSKQKSGRKKRWSQAERLRVVKEANAFEGSELGEFLRREGLHTADLERFRTEVLEAAARDFEAGRRTRGLSPEQKELRSVKKELARKEKALAEAAALLVLRGKWQAFLAADEEGDTNEGSDK